MTELYIPDEANRAADDVADRASMAEVARILQAAAPLIVSAAYEEAAQQIEDDASPPGRAAYLLRLRAERLRGDSDG